MTAKTINQQDITDACNSVNADSEFKAILLEQNPQKQEEKIHNLSPEKVHELTAYADRVTKEMFPEHSTVNTNAKTHDISLQRANGILHTHTKHADLSQSNLSLITATQEVGAAVSQRVQSSSSLNTHNQALNKQREQLLTSERLRIESETGVRLHKGDVRSVSSDGQMIKHLEKSGFVMDALTNPDRQLLRAAGLNAEQTLKAKHTASGQTYFADLSDNGQIYSHSTANDTDTKNQAADLQEGLQNGAENSQNLENTNTSGLDSKA